MGGRIKAAYFNTHGKVYYECAGTALCSVKVLSIYNIINIILVFTFPVGFENGEFSVTLQGIQDTEPSVTVCTHLHICKCAARLRRYS